MIVLKINRHSLCFNYGIFIMGGQNEIFIECIENVLGDMNFEQYAIQIGGAT